MLVRVLGALAFVAFLVLGIVWSSSSDRDGTLAAFWVVSFALVALIAIWSDVASERRPRLGELWDSVPGPSKDPADYR